MQSPPGSVFTLWGGSLNFGRQVAGLRAAGGEPGSQEAVSLSGGTMSTDHVLS